MHSSLSYVFGGCRLTILVLVLIGMSGVVRSEPAGDDSDTQIYVGHAARLTASIPSDWTVEPERPFDYWGDNGFVVSQPLAATDLEAACNQSIGYGETLADQPTVTSTHTIWRGHPACVSTIGSAASPEIPKVMIIAFAHPHPFELPGLADSEFRFAMVLADAEHFDAILSSISFDIDDLSPVSYATSVLDVMEGRSLYRDEIDWESLRRQSTDVMTWSSVHALIEQALGALRTVGDHHSWFVASDGLQEIMAPSNFDDPTGRRLPGGIGYLQLVAVPPAGGTKYVHTAHAIIEEIDRAPTCGWIVDLRGNAGGSVYPMVQALGSFIEDGRIFGYRYPSGHTEWINYRDGAISSESGPIVPPVPPPSLTYADPPVAVLVDSRTMSSAELTTMVLMEDARVRVFGSPTAGLTTVNRTFPLADSSVLNLAVSTMVDATGRTYPDGIMPDDVVASGAPSDDRVIHAAMDWLRQQPECAG